MIQLMLEGAPGSDADGLGGSAAQGGAGQDFDDADGGDVPPVAETMYENSSILYLKPGVLDREHVGQVESEAEGRCRRRATGRFCWIFAMLRRGYDGGDAAGELVSEARNDRDA